MSCVIVCVSDELLSSGEDVSVNTAHSADYLSHAASPLSLPCDRPVTLGDKESTPGDKESIPGGVESTPGDVVSTPGAGVNMSTNDDTNSVVAAALLDLCSSESPCNVLYPSADNTKSDTAPLAAATDGGAVDVSQTKVTSDSADIRHDVNSCNGRIAADIPAASSTGQRTTTEPSDKSDIIHCQPSIASPPATTNGCVAVSGTSTAFNKPDSVTSAPQVMQSKAPKCLSSKTQDIASNKAPVTSGDVALSPDTECVTSNSSLSSLCAASSCMCDWSRYPSIVHCQCEKCILQASLGHALQPYHLSSVHRYCDVGAYNSLRVSGGLSSALINDGLRYDSLRMCNTCACAAATRCLHPYHIKPETSSLSTMSVHSTPSQTSRLTCSGVSCHCLQPPLQHACDLQRRWWTVHNRNVNNSISAHHNTCPTVNNVSAPHIDRHLLHTDHWLDCVTAPTFWSYKTYKH
jgi:hypothetical protein